uniref:branched-chain amino acid transporter permease n=1 Tax=Acetatifactor sp. TaxID=1872090 RepID=UPI00405724D8
MEHTIAIILVVAICTLVTRALPFLIFGGKREVSPTIQYLGKVLPPAIMIILVVYCLKDIDIFSGTKGVPEFLAIGVVIILHLWKKNTLLSIGVGTLFYMFMV